MTRKINALEVIRVYSRGEFDPDLLSGVAGRALGSVVLTAREQNDPVVWLLNQGFGMRDIPVLMRLVKTTVGE